MPEVYYTITVKAHQHPPQSMPMTALPQIAVSVYIKLIINEKIFSHRVLVYIEIVCLNLDYTSITNTQLHHLL